MVMLMVIACSGEKKYLKRKKEGKTQEKGRKKIESVSNYCGISGSLRIVPLTTYGILLSGCLVSSFSFYFAIHDQYLNYKRVIVQSDKAQFWRACAMRNIAKLCCES